MRHLRVFCEGENVPRKIAATSYASFCTQMMSETSKQVGEVTTRPVDGQPKDRISTSAELHLWASASQLVRAVDVHWQRHRKGHVLYSSRGLTQFHQAKNLIHPASKDTPRKIPVDNAATAADLRGIVDSLVREIGLDPATGEEDFGGVLLDCWCVQGGGTTVGCQAVFLGVSHPKRPDTRAWSRHLVTCEGCAKHVLAKFEGEEDKIKVIKATLQGKKAQREKDLNDRREKAKDKAVQGRKVQEEVARETEALQKRLDIFFKPAAKHPKSG